MPSLQNFGMNIYLLIGLLFSCFCGCFLLVTVAVAIKILWWQYRKWQTGRTIYGQKYDERGLPLPRSFRGACTRCGHLFNVVYAVSDNCRLCTRCYGIERDTLTPNQARPTEGPAADRRRGAAEDVMSRQRFQSAKSLVFDRPSRRLNPH